MSLWQKLKYNFKNFNPESYLVHIVGNHQNEQQLFRSRGFIISPTIDKADIVVWTGGEDIDPIIYGEQPLKFVKYVNRIRDAYELKFWRQAVGKFKIGICRGGQLLNCLNGGSLWQHVEGHGSTHDMFDIETRKTVRTSSVHHQMFRPARGFEPIATATVSTYKESEYLVWDLTKDLRRNENNATDYEVVYYPLTRSLCFQGHPEYTSPPECEPYFFSLLDRLLLKDAPKAPTPAPETLPELEEAQAEEAA